MNLAYIAVSFPSLTETFVLREIEGIKAGNLAEELTVFAYKLPPKNWVNQDHRHLSKSTIYLRSRFTKNLMALIYFAFFSPRRVFTIAGLWLKELPALSMTDCLKTLIHIGTGFGLAREIKDRNIDHMHAHFATASTLALVAGKLTGTSFSFTAHASGDIYRSTPFLKEKLRSAKKIISISHYNKKYLLLISDYEINPDKVEVVYNGVEIPPHETKAKGNDIPVIFMSAAFSGFKGHGTLMDALEIIKTRNVPFVCRLAGGGTQFKRMASMARDKGLDSRVEMLGSQPLSAVYEHLRNSDIFVFPSEINIDGIRDGMPTAITEAMAHGLPVVATAVSGIPEQVEDGVNGFLVHERDEKDLADKLDILLKDAALRREMGAAGRKIAMNKFDCQKTIHQVVNAIAHAGRRDSLPLNR